MKNFGPNELLADVLNNGLCVGCGACVGLCPYFKTHKGKTAMVFPCTRTEGRCFAHCPKVEVDFDALSMAYWGHPYKAEPLGTFQRVVKAKAGEKMVKGTFQTGGTVTALMSVALESGLVESAVVTDRKGLLPVPRLVTTTRELIECASSKYMAAPTLAVFNEAVTGGKARLGVVATPCQATAVAQMRLNPLKRPDFTDPVGLVIGLFCTWALDTRLMIDMVKKYVDPDKIKKMHLPPPPAEVLCLTTDDGMVDIPLSEIRPLVPAGCQFCLDLTTEWSDISVGEVEGDKGWNTLIVRTDRGRDLVERAQAEGWLVIEPMPTENLANLTRAAANKKKRACDKAIAEGKFNSTEDEKRSVFRFNQAL